jgi:very-short-patch-repair endonuclease
MLWDRMRCIVEVDGRHHLADPAIRAADRERDVILRAAGWIIIRIPWYRVWRDLPRVLDDIERAFAIRRRP